MRTIGPWALDPVPIGNGSFAIVWKAVNNETGQLAAVKEISTERLSPKLQNSLASEIEVLQRASHRNIVGLLGLVQEPGKVFLVLEYCQGGDLGQYVRRYGRVSESTARYFMHQLSEGLRELRKLNVLHRDLKPQNLLLSDTTRQPTLKIADFGFARNLNPQGMAETLCGSPLYMAPEILQSLKYDAKADLWSVGTILHELVTGRPPFNGANHIQLLQNIERMEVRLPETLPGHLSPACRQLIIQLLKRYPSDRLEFDEFFKHAFFQGGQNPKATLSLPAQQPSSQHLHGGLLHTANMTEGGPLHGILHPLQDQSKLNDLLLGTSSQRSRAEVGDGMIPLPEATVSNIGSLTSKPSTVESMGDNESSDDEYVVVSSSSSALNILLHQDAQSSNHQRTGSTHATARQYHEAFQRQQSNAVSTMAAVAAAAVQAVHAVSAATRSVQPHIRLHQADHLASPHMADTSSSRSLLRFFPQAPMSSHTQVADSHPMYGAEDGMPKVNMETYAFHDSTRDVVNDHQASDYAAVATVVSRHSLDDRADCDELLLPDECHHASSSARFHTSGQDYSDYSNRIRIPDHLDQEDLVQRVLMLLSESARTRSNAAMAAALALEEALEEQPLGHLVNDSFQQGRGRDVQTDVDVSGHCSSHGSHTGAAGEGTGLESGGIQDLLWQAHKACGAAAPHLISLQLYSARVLQAYLAPRLKTLDLPQQLAPPAASIPCTASEDTAGVGRTTVASPSQDTNHPLADGSGSNSLLCPPSILKSASTQKSREVPSHTSFDNRSVGPSEDSTAASSHQAGVSALVIPDALQSIRAVGLQSEACGSGVRSVWDMGATSGEITSFKLRARSFLSWMDSREHEDLRAQVNWKPEELIFSGTDIVLDSALRYSRAAAADELLGMYSGSVEGYAKAADLLLYLLTPLPGISTELKPPLDQQDSVRVYRYYAAVKLRQATCMSALNAQLER